MQNLYLKWSLKDVLGATAGPSISQQIVKSPPQTHVRKKLEKVAQHVLNQPLKSKKK